jgi:hypothetical protein
MLHRHAWRVVVVAALAGEALVLGSMAGCGGSDPVAPPVESDGGTDTGSSSVQLNVADLNVYLGQTAQLDATPTTGSGAIAFAWTLKSAPQGSQVNTAAIGNANTGKPTLTPDVKGEYVLSVTATAGSASASKDVKVNAYAAPILYTLSKVNASPPYYEVHTVGSDGQGAHPLTCRVVPYPDAGPDSDNGGFFLISLFVSALGVDWWEAPPGEPSRVAFADFRPTSDGGGTVGLAIGTTESSCQNPPTLVRQFSGKNAMTLQPSFSPDGSKVAFIEQADDEYRIGAIQFDGSGYRSVATYCAGADAGGRSCESSYASRPRWLSDGRLAWVQDVHGNDVEWRIVAAKDEANASVEEVLRCAGEGPRQIWPLKDGSFITSFRETKQKPVDLVVMKRGQSGRCEIVRNLTKFTGAGSRARDFAVSPDQTEIAYLHHEGADAKDNDLDTGGAIYRVKIDGSGGPQPVLEAKEESFPGPRYIAGGSLFSFTRGRANEDAGGGELHVSVVPVGGGTVRNVANGDQGTMVLAPGHGGCNVAGGGPTMLAAFLASIAGIGILCMRRKR